MFPGQQEPPHQEESGDLQNESHLRPKSRASLRCTV